jgi:queuine tRNA-ribosyltransferase
MGVGTPINLLECISMGIDMFDCVMPSRNARHGMLFTSEGIINIKNQKWEKDYSVIDPNGTSYVDQTYSKAYLRHLIKSKEYLGFQIATIHNLAFYLALVKEARVRILDGTFAEWKNVMVKKLGQKL